MHFYKLLQGFALLCLSVLIISCGGGGAGASSGGGGTTLPVLRTQSGTVANGALTLTDPQTNASVSVAAGSLPNGTTVGFQVLSGGLPAFTSASIYVASSTSYAITIPSQYATQNLNVSVTLPDISTTPSPFRFCQALLNINDKTSGNPLPTQPTTGSPGFVTCTLLGAFLPQSTSNTSTTIFLDVVDLNSSLRSAIRNRNTSRGVSPSLYIYSTAQGASIQNLPPLTAFEGKRLCVLIHGRNQSATNPTIEAAADYLSGTAVGSSFLYDNVLVANYDPTASIKANAESLSSQLEPYVAASGSCDIIGYSMGGLIARWCIEASSNPLFIYQPRLITVGTPHRGVPLAAFVNLLGVGWAISEGDLELLEWNGTQPNGVTDFITELNSSSPSLPLNYYSLAGTSHYDAADGSLNNVSDQMNRLYIGLYRNAYGTAHASDYPSDMNDGVVAEYSANWIGLGTKSSSWSSTANAQSNGIEQTHYGLINNFASTNEIRPYLLKGVQVTIN